MNYITVKNLEKYHPGYKDRRLIWFKMYVSWMDDPEFAMLDEIDRCRFWSLLSMQLRDKETFQAALLPLVVSNVVGILVVFLVRETNCRNVHRDA